MANYQICQILNMNVTGRSNNIATLELVNFIEKSQLGTAINTEVPLEFHDALLVCHQTLRCALSPSCQLGVASLISDIYIESGTMTTIVWHREAMVTWSGVDMET